MRLLAKAPKALDPAIQAEVFRQELGSILAPDNFDAKMDAIEARMDAEDRRMGIPTPPRGARPAPMGRFTAPNGSFDVPFAIGRPPGQRCGQVPRPAGDGARVGTDFQLSLIKDHVVIALGIVLQ